jgi:hypothetical protein
MMKVPLLIQVVVGSRKIKISQGRVFLLCAEE